jgi:hypothetical protein
MESTATTTNTTDWQKLHLVTLIFLFIFKLTYKINVYVENVVENTSVEKMFHDKCLKICIKYLQSIFYTKNSQQIIRVDKNQKCE